MDDTAAVGAEGLRNAYNVDAAHVDPARERGVSYDDHCAAVKQNIVAQKRALDLTDADASVPRSRA